MTATQFYHTTRTAGYLSPASPSAADARAQVPMADVAHDTRPVTPSQARRQTWAYAMIDIHELTLAEAAVLLRVAYRAATGDVWESMGNLAKGARVSRETVRKALTLFIQLGLVTRHGKQFGGTVTYRPVWGAVASKG